MKHNEVRHHKGVAMKAYLAISGAIFGLVAVLHLWRMIAEWHGVAFWVGAGLTVVPAALSIWAWTLIIILNRRS
jgi:hypothetical protein